ncbi:MAG: hypothetical protein IH840_01855 [Candidatus Heimdallarchaeota archaeon]|nr:hypothetical protein [Candidatus Heimdallarchaeota archaeon]
MNLILYGLATIFLIFVVSFITWVIHRAEKRRLQSDYEEAEEELRELREENQEEKAIARSFNEYDLTAVFDNVVNLVKERDPSIGEEDMRDLFIELYKEVIKLPDFPQKSKLVDYLDGKLGLNDLGNKFMDSLLDQILQKTKPSSMT